MDERHFLGIGLTIIVRIILFVFIVSIALIAIGYLSPRAG